MEGEMVKNLSYHNRRMNETRRAVFGEVPVLDLSDYIDPEGYRERTKCRVVYTTGIEKVEYIPYRIRPVGSLRLVRCDEVDYPYKSADRGLLNDLFARRGVCEDVLIVRKGLITDTSICNVAFGNGIAWYTPREPLLYGTCRASLLDRHELIEADIRVEDLYHFSTIRLYNALINFGEIEFSVDKIEL